MVRWAFNYSSSTLKISTSGTSIGVSGTVSDPVLYSVIVFPTHTIAVHVVAVRPVARREILRHGNKVGRRHRAPLPLGCTETPPLHPFLTPLLQLNQADRGTRHTPGSSI